VISSTNWNITVFPKFVWIRCVAPDVVPSTWIPAEVVISSIFVLTLPRPVWTGIARLCLTHTSCVIFTICKLAFTVIEVCWLTIDQRHQFLDISLTPFTSCGRFINFTLLQTFSTSCISFSDFHYFSLIVISSTNWHITVFPIFVWICCVAPDMVPSTWIPAEVVISSISVLTLPRPFWTGEARLCLTYTSCVIFTFCKVAFAVIKC